MSEKKPGEAGHEQQAPISRKKASRQHRVGSVMLAAGLLNTPTAVATADYLAHSPPVTAVVEALNPRAIVEARAVRTEKRYRDMTLEANQAKELATVRTDSGITLHFYNSVTHKPLDVSVDPKAVNDLTNFAIASLSLIDQNYIPATDVQDLQRRAAQGQLNNVNMTVLFCNGAYNKVSDGADFVFPNTECGAGGLTYGIRTGVRTHSPEYHPTLMVSSHYKGSLDIPGTQALAARIPLSTTPQLNLPNARDELRKSNPPDRSALTTSIFLHELVHGLNRLTAHASPNAEKYDDQEHVEVIAPVQRLGEALMCNLPGIQNPTPYKVNVAFGISGDPTGEAREQLIAQGASNYYPAGNNPFKPVTIHS